MFPDYSHIVFVFLLFHIFRDESHIVQGLGVAGKRGQPIAQLLHLASETRSVRTLIGTPQMAAVTILLSRRGIITGVVVVVGRLGPVVVRLGVVVGRKA